MTDDAHSVGCLRQHSVEELARAGAHSLQEHLRAQAMVAHYWHSPLTFDKLEALLHDPDCLRYPTRLLFEYGEMAAHQFAEPDVDPRQLDTRRRALYLRPALREQPERVVLAVAYMIPLINYGDIIVDAHCLLYGATLLGLSEADFYERICALADATGAAPRLAEADVAGW